MVSCAVRYSQFLIMDKSIFSDNRFKKSLIFFSVLLFFLLIILINFKLLTDRLSSPPLILKKYLKSIHLQNYQKAYQFIHNKDKKYKSFQEYIREKNSPTSVNNIIEDSMLPLSKINNIKSSNNETEIEVTQKTPDLSNAESLQLIKKIESFSKEDIHKEVRNRNILKFIKNNSIPLKDSPRKYHLISEKGKWKVYLNWERLLEIKSALESAKKYEINNELAHAIEKYKTVLKLDDQNEKAKERIIAISSIIKKREYTSKIEFIKIEAKWYKEPKLGKKLGIFGEIKNNGIETIKDIQIEIKLLDQNGKIIFEENISPISEEGKVNKKKLFKPNSIVKFGYKVEDSLPHWKGKVSYKIKNIEFE